MKQSDYAVIIRQMLHMCKLEIAWPPKRLHELAKLHVAKAQPEQLEQKWKK